MAKTNSIKVIALQAGFYGGQRIREGQEFMVESGEKAKWFAPVASDDAASARATRAAKEEKDQVTNRPVALSELGKDAGKSFVETVANKKADGKKADEKSDLA